MDQLTQKYTEGSSATVVPVPFEMLPVQQQQWVDFCALGGLITHEDGQPQKISVSEFANMLQVERKTLYNWKKSIPDFDDLVAQRCTKMFSGARTIKVVNAWYVGATVKLNPQLIAMWMANQSKIEFRMPTQEVKHEAGGSILDVLEASRRDTTGVIEGETTDASS